MPKIFSALFHEPNLDTIVSEWEILFFHLSYSVVEKYRKFTCFAYSSKEDSNSLLEILNLFAFKSNLKLLASIIFIISSKYINVFTASASYTNARKRRLASSHR